MDIQAKKSLLLKTKDLRRKSDRLLGNLYSNEGKFERAIYHTKQSIELDPNAALPWGNLGTIYFTQGRRARLMGDPAEALRIHNEAIPVLTKAIEMDPSAHAPALMLAQCYRELALLADLEGRPDEAFAYRSRAIQDFLRVLKKEKRRKEIQAAWLPLAGVFIDAGLHDQALYYLNRLLKFYPSYPPGHYSAALCYFELGQF